MSAAQHAINRRGVIAMVASQAAFVCNDCFVKLASARLPTGEIMVVRGLLASICLLCLVAATGQTRALVRVASPVVALRAGVEGLIIVAFLSALPLLPLGIIISITQASPLLLTLFAILLFGESVGWRRWGAIIAGFAGVLLVSKPGADGLAQSALLALLAAVLIACRDILTRFVPLGIPSLVITFATTVVAIFAGAGLSLREDWVRPDPREMALLLAAAVAVSAGNFFIFQAFRGTEAALVSPFRYVSVIFGLALGFAVWQEVPDVAAVLGAALIVASGVYMIHRERVRARAARALQTAARQS